VTACSLSTVAGPGLRKKVESVELRVESVERGKDKRMSYEGFGLTGGSGEFILLL
jgi:hypothetical protein